MKIKIFIVIFIILVTLQLQESFSEDSIPSCNVGVFVSDDIQCYIEDSPPCKEPSLEKNGLCVVEKNDICKKGNVLTDGTCIRNSGNFRIDDPTFTKQHLLTGKAIEDTDSFVGAVYAYAGIGFVILIIGFFVVKKIKNRNKTDSRKLKKSKRRSQHTKRS